MVNTLITTGRGYLQSPIKYQLVITLVVQVQIFEKISGSSLLARLPLTKESTIYSHSIVSDELHIIPSVWTFMRIWPFKHYFL